MKFGACIPILVIAMLGAASTARGDVVTYPILVSCVSSGQICDPPFDVNVTTVAVLKVQYFVGQGHCSSMRMHFLVDGTLKHTTPFLGWPGSGGPLDSGVIDLGPVSSGVHQLSVQAEGIAGGCNDGQLSSWSGTLDVTTSAAPLCQISVTAAMMFDSHTLQADVTAEFGSDPLTQKSLRVSTTISGVDLTSAFPLPAGSSGKISESLFIDLEGQVPRFTDNVLFALTPTMTEGTESCSSEPQNAIVLLPVVIIPGLGNGGGGDGTFRVLESQLGNVSLPSEALGQPYRLRADAPDYPTLYTLAYPTGTASFTEGAVRLDALIAEIKSLTYADRVSLVTHSKGGLIARKFLAPSSGLFMDDVKLLIMAQVPHLGSLYAAVFSNPLPGLISNLTPVWPWVRATVRQPFRATPPNLELALLNREQLPASVSYVTIYSQLLSTPFTLTHHPSASDDIAGDGVVPAFSQRGLQVDPNQPTTNPLPIDAFANLQIALFEIPGQHIGYLETPEVLRVLTVLLLQ